MNQNVEQINSQILLKNALVEMRKLRFELEEIEQAKTEPIAIIGMGCRFPRGANDPEAFWQLLENGVDAVTEIPSDRWDVNAYYDPDPDATGKMYTRYGSFLDRVDTFDPKFFGISPREAERMDPQQRLLLEVSWEALENAGEAPEQLRNSKTGVFIGIFRDDYAQFSVFSGNVNRIDAFGSLGVARSIGVGRLSYVLGLQGPNLQLDTACSSSLLATHLACQSLRSGECNLALAGGVTLMLTPSTTISNCKLKALAKDGRCKTFDASADGYGRGEGCGIVVLKRLKDAISDRDNILAVIRGSAVNHDGRSNGLTAPNGSAQEILLRQALENAKVQPHQIQYVEVHGTGTSLGDPIEVLSLGSVLGKGRTDENPLKVGSVKTNIGHLEAAAGVAALIKVILALQHEKIPPHLHFKQPNPYIPWEKLPITVPTELTPWLGGEERLAGVSAFSMSGTNVHMILASAPEVKVDKAPLERPLHLLSLSAKSEAALYDQVGRYGAFLAANPNASLTNVCFTANVGRSHFDHRMAVWAESTAQLQQKLEAISHHQLKTGWLMGQTQNQKRPQIAFLFTGQGSQYIGMGRLLYHTQPTFRKALEQCDRILQPYLKTPLLEVLYPSTEKNALLLDQTAYTQPALFAIEYALAQLWMSWGIEPTLVMGHSVGEYAAACIAGVFSLEDGLKLIAERGRLMQALPENGQMVAVFASQDQVATAIQPYAQQVAIAAINGPKNIVLSGDNQIINIVTNKLLTQGIQSRQLKVSHAFHSPLMEPILDKFEQVANSITYSASTRFEVISNLTGELAQEEIATPDYWCRHLRKAVNFATSIETLYQQYKCELFIEIGPKPILIGMGRHCLPSSVGTWLPSLQAGKSDWETLLQSLGELHIRGVAVNWSKFDQDYPRYSIQLPTYPFQRKRYWIDTTDLITTTNGHSIASSTNNVSQASSYLSNGNRHSTHENNDLIKPEEILPSIESLQAPRQESEILRLLRNAPVNEQKALLISYLQTEVAAVMGLEPSELPDPRQGFFDMGMDSIVAVELKTKLEATLDSSLSSTLTFNYPNIERVAEYLITNVLYLEPTISIPVASDTIAPNENHHSEITKPEYFHLDRLMLIAGELDTLSDAEVETLLREKLATF